MKERIVKEWFERGEQNLEVAKLLFDKEKYFDAILFHIHRAVEKYLKGVLIYNGWELKKIHDLEMLITESMDFDNTFEGYLDFGRKLTGFYYEERYPPGHIPSYSKEEVGEVLKTAEDVIERLKEVIT